MDTKIATANSATEKLRFLFRAGIIAALADDDAWNIDLRELLPCTRVTNIGADVPDMREVATADCGAFRLAVDPVALGAGGHYDEGYHHE